MDNVKNDNYYINKILDDLDFLKKNFQNKPLKEIESNVFYIDSIMFRFIQIAENSERLTKEFKLNHHDIPWKEIKGMRNRIVHDYGFIDITIIYDTLINNIPELFEKLNNINL